MSPPLPQAATAESKSAHGRRSGWSLLRRSRNRRSRPIRRALGSQMVAAIEKLMGLVLTAIAVEMILAGLKRYFFDPA